MQDLQQYHLEAYHQTQPAVFHENSAESNMAISGSSTQDETPIPNEDKRVRRLMRNREAARRNRLKKKFWIDGLQKATETAKETNIKLKNKLGALEKELHDIHQFLLLNEYVRDIPPEIDF